MDKKNTNLTTQSKHIFKVFHIFAKKFQDY